MHKRSKFVCKGAILIAAGSFMSCHTTTGGERSRVIAFAYQGYGDTTCTILYGKVFEIRKTHHVNDTIAIPGAEIKAEQNGKVVKTDITGSFTIGLEKGIFTLTITKPGYETLKMANYISDPDRVSNTTVVLVKGAGVDWFEIAGPGR